MMGGVMMDRASQEQLLSRFRDYLASAEDESLEAPAEAPDLFTLLAELAALKNEVKIESRQVKAALEQFRELFEALKQDNARLEQQLATQAERFREQQQERERALLLELLELRDRLQAGHAQARRYAPGWLARRGGAQTFVAGMAEGMEMNLGRLDAILVRRGVQPIASLGKPFDPHTMQAADVEHDPALPEGEVVGELRPGYWHESRLLRSAEVIVNKRPEETPR
jgi:molecular chaperone GrpE